MSASVQSSASVKAIHERKATNVQLAEPSHITSLFALLQDWGMINAQGTLLHPSGIQPRPLKGLALERWKKLLAKEIVITIGSYKIRLTHEKYALEFSDYLKSHSGKPVETLLRGGYALYVLDLHQDLNALIEEFLRNDPLKELRRRQVASFLEKLKFAWETMEEPRDIDWLDLAECNSYEAKLLSQFFLGQLEKRLHPEEIQKKGYEKLITTKPTSLIMSTDRFLIARPKTESYSIDRVTGSLSHVSIASWCNIFIPIHPQADGSYIPKTFMDHFPQLVTDWGLKSLRVKEHHAQNTPALIAFCQYLYQGFELLPHKDALQNALLPTRMRIQKDEKIYQDFLSSIEGRIRGHAIEPISFLFSLALQFYSGPSEIWQRLWKDLLKKMAESSGDQVLVKFFYLFEEDFEELLSALTLLAMTVVFHHSDTVSICKVTGAGMILKVGKSELYLKKDLFEKKPINISSKGLENFLSEKNLKFHQRIDKGVEEILQRYIDETSSLPIHWNSYLHFVHCGHAGVKEPSRYLKRHLKWIVDPKTPLEIKELLLERMSLWYPALKGKKQIKGLDALLAIAKDHIQDAYDTLEAFPTYSVSFLCTIATSHPAFAFEKLSSKLLSDKEKIEITESILKSSKCSDEVVKEAVNALRAFKQPPNSTPAIIRKLWQKESLHFQGNEFFLHALTHGFLTQDEIENLMNEFLLHQDNVTCRLFLYRAPSSLTFNDKLKDKISNLPLSRSLDKDELKLAEHYIEKLLDKNQLEEAVLEVERHLSNWEEATYSSLLLKIFKRGYENPTFILHLFSSLKRSCVDSELKVLHRDFFHSLLTKNLPNGIQFLFLPESLKILGDEHQSLRLQVLTVLLSQETSSAKERELINYLGKILQHSIEENHEIIAKIVETFISDYSRSLINLTQIKQLLIKHGNLIVTVFIRKEHTTKALNLLHLLNLLKVETSSDLQEPLLQVLCMQKESSLFIASLQCERFPKETLLKKQLLIKALQEEKKPSREGPFKSLLEHLDESTLTHHELKEIMQGMEELPHHVSTILERFGKSPAIISLFLKEKFELIKTIPHEKLSKFLKKWSDLLEDRPILHPLLEYLLTKESQDLQGMLTCIRKTAYVNLSKLESFTQRVLEKEKVGAKKILLVTLLELDAKLDRQAFEYTSLWNSILVSIPTLGLDTAEILHLLDHSVLANPNLEAHKGMLFLEAVNQLPEKSDPSQVKEMGVRLDKLLQENLSSDLIQAALTLYKSFTYADRSKHFQIILNHLEDSILSIGLFFEALLNQPDLLHEWTDFLESVLKKFHHVPRLVTALFFMYLSELQKKEDVSELALRIFKSLYDHQLLEEDLFRIYRLIFISTKLDLIVKKPSFDFEQFHHVLREWIAFPKTAEDIHESGLQHFKNIVTYGLVRSIPSLTSTSLLNLFLEASTSYLQEDWQNSMDTRELMYIFVFDFLQCVRDSHQKDEDLIHKVFIPFSNYFVEHHNPLQQSTGHLRSLYYLGLSLVDEKREATHLEVALSKLKVHVRELYDSWSIMGEVLPEPAEMNEVEGKIVSNVQLHSMAANYFDLFPSNHNLARAFKTLDALTAQTRLQPSHKFLSAMIGSLKHVAYFKTLSPIYLTQFAEFYYKIFLQFMDEDSSHKSLGTQIFEEYLVFLSELFKKVESPIDLLSYYDAYVDILMKALKIKAISYETFLNKLLKIEELDENQDRKFNTFFTLANLQTSPFKKVTEALTHTPLSFKKHELMERDHQFLDWVFKFFQNPRSQTAANLYLERYLTLLVALKLDHFQEYLNRVQACFPVNRSNQDQLLRIGEALLVKPRKPISDSLLNQQAKLFMDWVYPFQKDHPEAYKQLMEKAIGQKLFKNGGLKAFLPPQ